MEFGLGCLKPQVDLRNYKLATSVVDECGVYIPASFKVDESLMKVKNQGSVGSCVAHATSSILEYHTNGSVDLSTNFIYGIRNKLYNRHGSGMYLNDACKIVANYGDMTLKDCPGNTEADAVFNIASNAFEKTEALNRAKEYKVDTYFNCDSETAIKKALMEYGPVLACIKWYEDSYAKDGKLIYNSKNKYGYHAIVIYGWNETGWLCQNSWGIYWGDYGRFEIPYSYKIEEAKGFKDHKSLNDDLIIPKNNSFLDVIYKVLNSIINFFKGMFK